MRSIVCSLLFALVALPAHAQFAPLRNALPFHRNGASLDMDFVGGNYMVSVTSPVTYTSLTAFLADANVSGTFSRNSMGTYFDNSGTLQTAPANTPRIDYDPVTHAAKGLLIEEARTNSIRNNTMVGTVPGSPGTKPTFWSVFYGVPGISDSIIGTGTENGISYFDLQISGTATGSGQFQVYPESTNIIAASSGQTWTARFYLKLQSGSTSGITSQGLFINEWSSGGAYLGGLSLPVS